MIDGRLLVWEDNFDGDTIQQWWRVKNYPHPNYNGEAQWYTNRPSNVRVEGGNLVIQANREAYEGKEWTSGRLDTNNAVEPHFGRLEARIKMPVGLGFWPAFWTLGAYHGDPGIGMAWPTCGEIDIMEALNSESSSRSAIHGTSLSSQDVIFPNIDRTQWHVYAVEWTPTAIDYYVDAEKHWTVDVTGMPEFNWPHFLLLNLAMDGWAATPDGTTPDGAQMLVDWVRVWAPVGDLTPKPPTAISLDKATVTATVGGADQRIVPTITPADAHDKATTWTSSNAAVAITANGYVRAVAPGTCIVTARTWNGRSATCTVTVP